MGWSGNGRSRFQFLGAGNAIGPIDARQPQNDCPVRQIALPSELLRRQAGLAPFARRLTRGILVDLVPRNLTVNPG